MLGLRAVGLFEGIGGLALALEHHGIEVIAQVENDPYCTAVLERHWPGVDRYGDITEVDWDAFTRTHGHVDLVAAGFPCQPVSQAGRRKAQADPRWLWPEVTRCLRHIRPGYVFLENTLGLLSRGFDTVLGDLAALGFDAEWDCLQAADVGAPHERDRVFVLAYANGARHGPGSAGEPGGRPEPAWRLQPGRLGAEMEHPPVVGGEPVRREQQPGDGDPGRGLHLGQLESGVGRSPARLPGGLDGHRWPAPPGPAYGWEPPRTVSPRTVAYRGQRLKALGNAVVPQQGALAFAVLWQRMLERVA